MYSFIVPKNNNKDLIEFIFFNIKWDQINSVINNTDINDIYINHSLYKILNNVKEQITQYENKWDTIKKYTNKHEFIHTIIPNYKNSISKMKPLSRAFYKMIEIYNFYELDNYLDKNISSFNLAEGPGGFIEALIHLRNNNDDKYIGMTLVDDNVNSNIPGWQKSMNLLINNKNISIELGPKKNGDLFNPDNYLYVTSVYKNSCDLVTGDGGFDFSVDYNNQETMSIKLIFTQIMYALQIQKNNGCFILKIFDLFKKISVDLIYLLTIFYDEVFICKPNTSREANSEKYIFCKGFNLYKNIKILDKLNEFFHIFLLNTYNTNNVDIKELFNLEHNLYFINKLNNINNVLGQVQINNILLTLNLINSKNKNERIELLKKNNINKCIEWCKKYKINYNDTIINTNIFIK